MNRRAISPLIATVLLLAFAVALATMFVSYFLEATKYDPCVDASIKLNNKVCYNGQTATFIVSNSGSEQLSGLHITFISPTKDPVNNPVASSLQPGDATKIELVYSTLDPSSVELTIAPKVTSEGKEYFCSKQEIKTKLDTCA